MCCFTRDPPTKVIIVAGLSLKLDTEYQSFVCRAELILYQLLMPQLPLRGVPVIRVPCCIDPIPVVDANFRCLESQLSVYHAELILYQLLTPQFLLLGVSVVRVPS